MSSREHRGYGGAPDSAGAHQGIAPGRRTLVERAYPVQRKPSQAPPSAPSAAAPAAPAPSGRYEQPDFGGFWVVPDDTVGDVADAVGMQITETEYAAAAAAWAKIKDGSGRLTITERDDDGHVHAGFRANVIAQLGLLMMKPVGRGLLIAIVNGGAAVAICPSSEDVKGGAETERADDGALQQADGRSGGGSASTIHVDPNFSEDDITVCNESFEPTSDPLYIVLGHELIHARHNQLGTNRQGERAVSRVGYPNLEEEQTIATGAGATENKLRAEHGLEARLGIFGDDRRFPA